jgi:hypothetical protein
MKVPEEQTSKIADIYLPICSVISMGLVLFFYCLYVMFVWYSLFVVIDFYHRKWQSTLLDVLLLFIILWSLQRPIQLSNGSLYRPGDFAIKYLSIAAVGIRIG